MRRESNAKLIRYGFAPLLFLTLLTSFAPLSALAQQGKSSSGVAFGEWTAYGRDKGGERYSPLKQINRRNVKDLKIAWTYRTGDVAAKGKTRATSAFQMTPIMVDGTLFLTTPFNRVMALNPSTGKELWSYDPKIDLRKGYSNPTQLPRTFDLVRSKIEKWTSLPSAHFDCYE